MLGFLSLSKDIILDLLFPVFCLNCRKEGAYLCENCKNGMNMSPPTCFVCKKLAFGIKDGGAILSEETGIHGKTCKICRQKSKIYGFLSPLRYHDILAENLIHCLKYNGIRSISKILADILEDYFNKYRISFPRDAVIVPIPLHKKRERIRGFNQAILIGKHLSEKIGMELRDDILRKIKETRRQTGLSAEERRNNLSGAFALRNSAFLKNKTVLLLDDVRTTGSTMEEAAGVLKSAGVRRVWAITVAH